MPSVLFVCTGNICRSPTAEAVFRDRVLKGRIDVDYDSVGIQGYHVGEPPDYRSVEVAQGHGIDMGGLLSRKLIMQDFERFDLLIAMDKGHERAMLECCDNDEHRGKVKLLLDYCDDHRGMDTPDPYYGDMVGFERTYRLIVSGIDALVMEYF